MATELFEQTKSAIEDIIRSRFGLSPEENSLEQPADGVAAWGLIKGSANIYIVLSAYSEYCYFQVFSPILTWDENVKKDFFIKILSLNATIEMLNTAFAIKDNKIIVKSDIVLKSPEKQLIESAVLRLGELADKYDNLLQDEFEGIHLI